MEILLLFAFVLALAFVIEWLLRQLKIADYESRYVLITGCDSGFGHELARKLDKLNFHVFACCLTKDAVEKFSATSSSKLKAIEMDVSKDASIEKAMEIVKRVLPDGKGLWAVVNNAGIVGGIGSIKLQTRQDYENTLAVNLYGVIMVTKACMPLVLKEKGRIVNTASILGRIAFLNSSYAISKYGIEAFSDVLSHKTIEMIEKTGSSKLHLVVDAYCHAITAKFPKKRYLVGSDAKYVYWLLWSLPEWLSDFYLNWQGAYSV